MKKLKIALIAPLEERVPPRKYGGTELVVANLADGLAELGHQVDLYAAGTSITKANLIPIIPKPIREVPRLIENIELRSGVKYISVSKVLKRLNEKKYDIVHNHMGIRMAIFADAVTRAPVVTTLHGPVTSPMFSEIYKHFPKLPYISISNSQRRPAKKLNYLATIYNGVKIERFPFNPTPGKYLFFLGRMSPEKGPVQAIKIAKLAKLPLLMAAKIDPVDREFFEKEVKPAIDGRQIKYLGEVGENEKIRLLKNARALLATIMWEEPFGLFMIEAMACGTPVVAFRRGSVPEVIRDKKTGFIVKSIPAAAKAVKQIDKIKRIDCRRHVEKNFTAQIMTQNYLKAYQKLLKH